jgi:hypothetical protein
MAQSLFEENGGAPPAGFVEEMSEAQEALRAELALIVERIDGLERKQTGALQKLDQRQTAALAAATESAATAARARIRILWIAAIAALALATAALIVTLARTA